MNVSRGSIEQVSKKMQLADLNNVRIEKCDALETGLDAASIDKVFLFGVISFPPLYCDKPDFFKRLMGSQDCVRLSLGQWKR